MQCLWGGSKYCNYSARRASVNPPGPVADYVVLGGGNATVPVRFGDVPQKQSPGRNRGFLSFNQARRMALPPTALQPAEAGRLTASPSSSAMVPGSGIVCTRLPVARNVPVADECSINTRDGIIGEIGG